MPESTHFKETIFNFGDAKADDVIDFTFEFKGEPSDVQYVERGCGCTDAFFKDGAVRGKLELVKAQTYKPGINNVNKNIAVYMEDGKPHFVGDDVKRRIVNSEKIVERLQIMGTVTQSE